MENLNNIRRVRINDYSQYVEGKSCNGGCYGFWTDYKRTETGWEISYGSTADSDFSYCPCCGSFNDHYNYKNKNYTCGEFEVITTEELEEIIRSFEEEHEDDEKYFIKYYSNAAKPVNAFGN